MTTPTYPHASAKCPCKCRGGKRCDCDGNHDHTQHMCRDKDCACHTAAAWGLVKVVRKDGREVYEHQNVIRVQP